MVVYKSHHPSSGRLSKASLLETLYLWHKSQVKAFQEWLKVINLKNYTGRLNLSRAMSITYFNSTLQALWGRKNVHNQTTEKIRNENIILDFEHHRREFAVKNEYFSSYKKSFPFPRFSIKRHKRHFSEANPRWMIVKFFCLSEVGIFIYRHIEG